MCDEGWIGKSCTEKVTPCTSSPCLNNGKCSVNGDNYKCECVGKWEGTECQSERKEVSTGMQTNVGVSFFKYFTSLQLFKIK